ncbi:hypothetical protein VM1G_08285 [Cytospora mali]|uniref:F-box domain-containing protein n=1 Tax=Cytospora mali TaxID=578113 RepID=A0A194W8Z8_CYTMA|nr:hypothetical protein VM1G_08285 [Valsa mali]
MALIIDLPPELLDRICELIPSQATLAKLARCSHQFYDVAAPRLFRSIELSRTKSNDGLRYLEPVTALFLRKPELGRSVRHLALRENSKRSVVKNGEPLLPEIQEAIRQLAAQTGMLPTISPTEAIDADNSADSKDAGPSEVEVEVVDMDEDDDAESDASHSNWSTTDDGSDYEDDPDDVMPTDAGTALGLAQSSVYFRDALLLAVLVQCIPKVTSLDLELMEPSRLRFVQIFLHLSLNTEHLQLFDHVKTVCLGSSRPEVRLDLWRDLFTLPSLDSVYMHRVTAVRGETLWGCGPSAAPVHPLAGIQPRSLDITHIEMRDCRIAPWELRRIVGVPKALRTFIYDVGEGTNEVEPVVNISYKSIREALEQQKDTLEQIWIDYPHDYLFDEWGGAGASTRPMGSFVQFKKLKRFRIASTYLFGFTEDTDINRIVDSLPEQVEMLHLTHGDEDEELTAGLKKLLEARQLGRFQDLKELKVDVCLPWLFAKGRQPLAADHTRSNKDVMAELVHKADGLDLEMKIFINHSQNRTYAPARRVEAARMEHWTGPERRELKWGFDGEVDWPQRMSGCMQIPDYPEVTIDEQGTMKFMNGDEPAEPISPEPALLGQIFFG